MPVDSVLMITVGIEVSVDWVSHEAVHAAKSWWLICILSRREVTRRLMVTICALLRVVMGAYASVLRRVSSTSIVLHS